MSQRNLTLRYDLEIPNGNDVVLLTLERTNKAVIRARLSGNGDHNSAAIPPKNTEYLYSNFLTMDVADLVTLFDPTFTVANAIDSDWLIERLLAKRQTMEMSEQRAEALDNRIKNLAIVSNLTGLYAVGQDVMTALYGHNWMVEQASQLIKQSKKWAALVERIELARKELDKALSS